MSTEEHLIAFARSMIGGSAGYPDDQNPLPPGPWDPVIRVALEHLTVFGPQPDPWRVAIGSEPITAFGPTPDPWRVVLAALLRRYPAIYDVIGGGGLGDEVMLNPQPLPPRYAFLIDVTQAVIGRAELMQEIADAFGREGESAGNAYLARFVDDWCPTGYKPRWPFPGPRPKWFAEELNGVDLIVMATQFDQAAKETASEQLRNGLTNAAAKFAEAGASRL